MTTPQITRLAPALTLKEVKQELRIEDHGHEDNTVQRKIDAAASYLGGSNGVLGRSFDVESVVCKFSPMIEIELAYGPVSEISSITVVRNGAPEPYEFEYSLIRKSNGKDYIKFGSLPNADRGNDTVEIVYVTESAPASLKEAALRLIAHWFDNREAASTEGFKSVPLGFDMLVAPHRQGLI